MQTVNETIQEVIYSVLPITILVLILQFTIIWMPFEMLIQFIIGVIFISVGLIFFLLGVNVGLLPVGSMIGAYLPGNTSAWLIILFSFILGFSITVAEPDVHVLSGYVDQVSGGEISKWMLILPVALGLGIFVALSMARVMLNISIKWILFSGYSLVFALALSPWTPENFIPISFDASGVTTGPMAVPFILAFGVGIASVIRSDGKSTDGFGMVAIASIGPLLAVLILGILHA
ncbi:MAG: DUF1538 domain-containing protein [Balneolaceae bacterium]